MSKSKRHHYVPKAILRNFLFRGNGTYYLSKEKHPSPPQIRNIDSIFCKRHYNSFTSKNGTRRDELEIFFATEFDNNIPHWIDTFTRSLKSGNVEFLNEADRVRFVQFFYNHTKRTPDFLEPIAEEASREVFHDNFISELEAKTRPLTSEEKQRLLDPQVQREISGQSRVVNISTQATHILDIMVEKRVVVATPQRKNKQFIVGSHPVARFEDYPKQHLEEDGVEIWTTFSPTVAVGLVGKGAKSGDVVSLPDQIVRRVNETIAKQSRAIASRSPELIKSIARAVW